MFDRRDRFVPKLWIVLFALGAGIAFTAIGLILFPPRASEVKIPAKVTTVKPTYTPFTWAPTREPHPRSVYYPPGWTASPGR